jgi:ATP-dependent Clp protease ATP-binding subunit ClpC
VFEQFTDRARRVIVLAQEESRLLNHNYIGTEHLLLGLLHEAEGIGSRALTSLGVSLETARATTQEIIGAGQSPPSGHIPFTPRAKKVLELSLRESLQLGHNYIGTEHVLLGLIREGEGVAAQVLARLGAGLADARQAVIDILSTTPPEERPMPRAPGRAPASDAGVSSWGRQMLASTQIGDEADLGPNCPTCRVPIASSLAWERMDGVGEDSKRIAMIVVFCMDCGTTIGVLPHTQSDESPRPGAAPPAP